VVSFDDFLWKIILTLSKLEKDSQKNVNFNSLIYSQCKLCLLKTA
jgi:hypothetical protein